MPHLFETNPRHACEYDSMAENFVSGVARLRPSLLSLSLTECGDEGGRSTRLEPAKASVETSSQKLHSSTKKTFPSRSKREEGNECPRKEGGRQRVTRPAV
uniref:Uncharacterized protein n=1 Tax=Odontella aurita TaxID=265563 RepID=A0A7S4IYS3_9STRA|mmetsp:Transcript_33204/g.98689  ORF Transcript_33204/g.98689 Transcript_33204/m.98689 type:complete len:101 (+) Transcript_33204:337-639(+)